jgi:carbamoyltransferase
LGIGASPWPGDPDTSRLKGQVGTVTLGIWDGHDAGAALFEDGRLVFAVNEERLSRRKLEIRFPAQAIAMCLSETGHRPADVALVACSTTDPAKTLTRYVPSFKERYYQVRRRLSPPGALAGLTRTAKYRITEWAPGRVSGALSRRVLRRALSATALDGAELALVDHHEAHAAAAAFGSGWPRCGVLTIDGVGDGLSCTISRFDGRRLTRLAATPADASLGVFFEHVTALLNMRELEDEGKVMALADYASPIADEVNPLLPLVRVEGGRLHMASPSRRLRPWLRRVQWSYPNEQFAFLAQRLVERTMEALARETVRLTGEPAIAVAGGVASNVKATRRMRHLPEVGSVSVYPHMGDGGLAVGAAAAALARRDVPVSLPAASLALGPAYGAAAIEEALRDAGCAWERPTDLPAAVADLLSSDAVVLWFQGRMELGPRALGARSVLARPDRAALRDRLNLVLKRRVWYQPFCPSMLASEAAVVLEDYDALVNRHMTMAYLVRPACRERLQGVISVDGSCRPQFVTDQDEGVFVDLLRAVKARLGLGVVLNTSFNIHGRPLVCTPREAVAVFRETHAEALAIGPCLVRR